MRQPQRQKSNAQTANIKQKIIAADKGYEVSDIPFSLVSLYLLSQSLTSNKAAHLNPNEFSRLGNSTKLVQVIGTCTIFSFPLRNPVGAFSFFVQKKRKGEQFFSQIRDFHLFRTLRGKTKLLWSHPAVERLGDSQPTIMLAFVGPPLGGPTLDSTQLHTVSVGHAGGSKDFRRRFCWDLGRSGCQILADWIFLPVRFWQLDGCNWKKKSTLNWSWRFLGFSGEVEVWCSQIHRFLFCSVLFPKRGQSSQSEP